MKRWVARTGGSESGAGLVELMVAGTVLSVVLLGLAASMGAAMKVVAGARQGSVVAAVATEHLERLGNHSFNEVALDEAPVCDASCLEHETHPNRDVDGSDYWVDRSASEPEELIIDEDIGAVQHHPPVDGAEDVDVFQYVTWMDQAAMLKRVVVVAVRNTGTTRPQRVTMSIIVSLGVVTWDGSDVEDAAGPTPTPGPSPAADPLPTPSPICVDDVFPPTATRMTLLEGTESVQGGGHTNSTSVQVQLEAEDPCTPLVAELSNDGANWTVVAVGGPTLLETVSWALGSGDGLKTIWGRFVDGTRDLETNMAGPITSTINLDQSVPATPEGFQATVSCPPGNDRTVNMIWTVPLDPPYGYRLYRSINNGQYEVIAAIGGPPRSDTHLKTLDSVRYVVRSYNLAGTESGDSDVLSYNKNACS